MRARAVLAVALVCVLGAGCGSSSPGAPPAFETQDDRRATLAALDAARRLYASQNWLAYYVDFQRTCFCAVRLPVRLSVFQGRITSVRRADTGELLPLGPQSPYLSIEQLFDYLERQARDGAWEVRARYDARDGYPLEAYVDPVKGRADDEEFFTLGGLARQFGPIER